MPKPAATKPVRKRSQLTIVGDEARAKAQRVLLLKTMRACGWNMTAAAEALDMGHGTSVIRALKELAPEEYAKAKADGRVSQGNHREA